mmetsp:Transcript_68556/g.134606  ORF Transcript_68556/g.134606 Transcript_68556/m.134606 type:complete len:98 (+) Transcript_68556:613-906(+)
MCLSEEAKLKVFQDANKKNSASLPSGSGGGIVDGGGGGGVSGGMGEANLLESKKTKAVASAWQALAAEESGKVGVFRERTSQLKSREVGDAPFGSWK